MEETDGHTFQPNGRLELLSDLTNKLPLCKQRHFSGKASNSRHMQTAQELQKHDNSAELVCIMATI